METVEIVYYTCLNNECEKYRNVFAEGDPQHEQCARERLFLEGERGMPVLGWLVPVAVMLAAAAGVVALRRMRANRKQKPAILGEERPTQTWSGTESHLDERQGHAVPPPIV
jgi:hypothetical protein